MLHMVTWIPSIYPHYVSIYSSTMDPSWVMVPSEISGALAESDFRFCEAQKYIRCSVGIPRDCDILRSSPVG